MVRAILLFFAVLVLFIGNVHAQNNDLDVVALTIPEAILVKAVQQSLPVQIDPGSDTVGGSIHIENIENLQLDDQNISASVTLVGNEIQIKTTIAGQQLRLKVGNVKLEFAITADTRFDNATQTLFIKPTVTDLQTKDGQAGDELGTLLVGLFNGQEFPLAIDKLQPIITDTGSKKLAIEMVITDITISENRNMHPWIVFYFCDQTPIGLAFIHLSTRPSMNRNGGNADVLKAFRYFNDIFRIIIPA